MNLIKVAVGVVNQTPFDWQKNKTNIINCIEEARSENISLLCFPELCVTGYGCEDMFYSPGFCETAYEVLSEIKKYTKEIVVSVGLPIRYHNRLYNAACIIADGKIEGFVCKKNLAGNSIYYEPRWFHAWETGKQATIEVGNNIYPIGDLIFQIDGVKIGYEICQDAWVADRAGRELYLRGIDIILNPSASHFEFGKSSVRERFVLDASRAFGVSYIYVNLLGNESGRTIFDGDAIIASGGRGIASGKRFSYEDYLIIPATIDVDLTRLDQVQNQVHLQQTEEQGTVKIDYKFPSIQPAASEYLYEQWEMSGFIKEEEFARGISLALFDYLRKSKSNGWVISLSGGADSSAVACLCALAVKLCVNEVGLDVLKQKLTYNGDIQSCVSEEELCRKLITTVYQATENSSEKTLFAATSLANSINAEYFQINIDNLVKEYTSMIEKGLQRELTWERDDVTLQNIQARVRAPSVWMVANVKNALLLSTSNRSEASVGYATMDGDTAGSISPLAGIDKVFIRTWLIWLETRGLGGALVFSGLNAVNQLQPTAELRPLERAQTDESDLMPYEILNAIENAAIRDKRTPKEVLTIIQAQFNKVYTEELLVQSVKRFFRLWSRNQWKRERYAPSFHIDSYSVDPKTWCRFPILSGGFEFELAQLNEQVEGHE